jgi:hypothetical protein
MLSDVFGIQTVAELGSKKYFAVAGARVALATKISTADLLHTLT